MKTFDKMKEISKDKKKVEGKEDKNEGIEKRTKKAESIKMNL